MHQLPAHATLRERKARAYRENTCLIDLFVTKGKQISKHILNLVDIICCKHNCINRAGDQLYCRQRDGRRLGTSRTRALAPSLRDPKRNQTSENGKYMRKDTSFILTFGKAQQRLVIIASALREMKGG